MSENINDYNKVTEAASGGPVSNNKVRVNVSDRTYVKRHGSSGSNAPVRVRVSLKNHAAAGKADASLPETSAPEEDIHVPEIFEAAEDVATQAMPVIENVDEAAANGDSAAEEYADVQNENEDTVSEENTSDAAGTEEENRGVEYSDDAADDQPDYEYEYYGDLETEPAVNLEPETVNEESIALSESDADRELAALGMMLAGPDSEDAALSVSEDGERVPASHEEEEMSTDDAAEAADTAADENNGSAVTEDTIAVLGPELPTDETEYIRCEDKEEYDDSAAVLSGAETAAAAVLTAVAADTVAVFGPELPEEDGRENAATAVENSAVDAESEELQTAAADAENADVPNETVEMIGDEEPAVPAETAAPEINAAGTDEDISSETPVFSFISDPDTEPDNLTPEPARGEHQKKKRRGLGVLVPLLLVFAAAGGYGAYRADLAKHEKMPYEVTGSGCASVAEDGTATFTVELNEDAKKKAAARYAVTESPSAPAADSGEWLDVEGHDFTFDVGPGHYYVYVSDENGVLSNEGKSLSELEGVHAVNVTPSMNYLAVGVVQNFEYTCVAIGNTDVENVEWSVSDENLADVKDNAIHTKAVGDLEVTATVDGGASGSAHVLITDLITPLNSDTYSKPLLKGENIYTQEQAALIDEILFDRVEKGGGYGTRGGVVAATRFICLEFPYRVAYFYENGRMSPSPGRYYADGEGRYYHRGMYLDASKYETVIDPDAVRYGPAYWGAPLVNWEEKYGIYHPGVKYPNGLDCSGFVSWCLINGGLVYGDVGAGASTGIMDLSDVGHQLDLSDEVLQQVDLIKPGDLIYTDGHMAIVIGTTEERIYVAEALIDCVRVTSFVRKLSAVPWYLYTKVALMDDEYETIGNGQGTYENWYDLEDIEKDWNQSWW